VQQSINERLKFLIDSLNLSARAFSARLQVPESNTRNYLDKSTKLNSDYLERISRNFESVNLRWLITGEGEPFLTPPAENEHDASYAKKFSGNNVGVNHGVNHQQSTTHTLNTDALKRENELLKAQLVDKERLIQVLLNQLPSKP
jgi:hypothetical protein